MQKTVIGFDKSAGLPILATHCFTVSPDGQLVHIIDDKTRATVPPEGWADYVKEWPEAGDVVDSLRRPVSAAQEQTAAEKIAVLESALAAALAAKEQPQGAENEVAN